MDAGCHAPNVQTFSHFIMLYMFVVGKIDDDNHDYDYDQHMVVKLSSIDQ